MKEFVLKGRLTLERVTFYVTGNARGPRRRDLDLLRGRNARERLCRAVVCRSRVETPAACSMCARMNRRRGSGRGCIVRPEARLVRRVGAGRQPKLRYGNISDRLREVQVDMGNFQPGRFDLRVALLLGGPAFFLGADEPIPGFFRE